MEERLLIENIRKSRLKRIMARILASGSFIAGSGSFFGGLYAILSAFRGRAITGDMVEFSYLFGTLGFAFSIFAGLDVYDLVNDVEELDTNIDKMESDYLSVKRG